VRADHVVNREREELAVAWLPAGRYRVEVTRARQRGGARLTLAPLRGMVSIVAPELSRRVPFSLLGERAYIGEIEIQRLSRLVPAPQ
jgi:hypothetical protein